MRMQINMYVLLQHVIQAPAAVERGPIPAPVPPSWRARSDARPGRDVVYVCMYIHESTYAHAGEHVSLSSEF